MLALLAGCTVGPNYAARDSKMPDAFANVPSGAVEGVAGKTGSTPEAGEAQLANWWRSFNDPALESLVQRAIAANLDLKGAEARVREARGQRRVAGSADMPQVNASGGYTRSRLSENGSQSSAAQAQDSGGSDLFQGGFDASWELDVFGGTRRNVEAADATIAATENDRRDVLVSVLAEVCRNYVDVRGFQQRLSLAERTVALQQQTLELAEARFKAGLTGELDVSQARAQLATRQSQIPPLAIGLKQATHRLGVLLGEQPNALSEELAKAGEIPTTPEHVPVGLPADLLRRRPDIRRAERQLAAATARVGAATADLYPKFRLVGDFGFQSSQFGDLFDMNSRFWSIGPSVSVPIFEAGRIRGNIAVQEARVDQAAAAYDKAVLTAMEDVENSLVSFVQEQSRRRTLAASVEANRRSVELSQQLYQSGIVDFRNVLENQRNLYDSEDQLVQSVRGVSANLIALYKALGGGWESVEAPEPATPRPEGTSPANQ
ncbi:MAG: efflux transporter outer membrane subunit [Planctomycetota bacterium]|nr:efflux transporter outer membrane subunit [Planctomycetota bacterium]